MIPADWKKVVPFLAQDKHLPIWEAVEKIRSQAVVYPPRELVFNALRLTRFDEIRVVIVGQDPYHGTGQAHGLAFSVPEGQKFPPSLRNIMKEIDTELCNGKAQPYQRAHSFCIQHSLLGTGKDVPEKGTPKKSMPKKSAPKKSTSKKNETRQVSAADGSSDLTRWAQQGVLLLNTTLTVTEKKPASHAKLGWTALTDDIIRTVAAKRTGVVFLLWGAHAHGKERIILEAAGADAVCVAGSAQDGHAAVASLTDAGRGTDDGNQSRHLVLKAAHPSPLSAHRGFFGCDHFRITNAWLAAHGRSEVYW